MRWLDLLGTVSNTLRVGLLKSTLDANAITEPRTHILPNQSGTLAITDSVGAAQVPRLAVAEGATTPNPGSAEAAGAIIWSTTLNANMRWNGTAWNVLVGGVLSDGTKGDVVVSSSGAVWNVESLGAGKSLLDVSGITTPKTHALPDASGTVALRSDIFSRSSGITAYVLDLSPLTHASETISTTQTENAYLEAINSSGVQVNKRLTLINQGVGLLILLNNGGLGSGSSSDKFLLPKDETVLLPGEGVTLVYSTFIGGGRWRQLETSYAFPDFHDQGTLILPATGSTVNVIGAGGAASSATLSTIDPTNGGGIFQRRGSTQITNATANGSADVRGASLRYFRGSVGTNGILFSASFRNTALSATGSFFVGLTASTAAITTQARTVANTIGIGTQGGEGAHRIFSRDGTAVTAINLGTLYPSNDANASYTLHLYAPPNSTTVYYAIRRTNATVATTGTLTANLPAQTQALAPRINVTVGATAAANTAQFNYLFCRSAI